jgi:hypothetical protein
LTFAEWKDHRRSVRAAKKGATVEMRMWLRDPEDVKKQKSYRYRFHGSKKYLGGRSRNIFFLECSVKKKTLSVLTTTNNSLDNIKYYVLCI